MSLVTRTRHNGRGYPMRAFAGRTGMWVQVHGEWCRPLHVWLFRGAWRVICRACLTAIDSGDKLYDHGWATQGDGFDAALAHSRTCPVATTREVN